MKKVLPVLVLMGLFVVLLAPLETMADTQGISQCTIKNVDRVNAALGLTGVGVQCNNPCIFDQAVSGNNPNCSGCCLMNTVFNVTDWFFIVLVALAAIFVLMGAFSLLFSGGSPDKIDTGRKYIIYAAVGLAIGFLSKAIPSLVRMIIGG